MQLKLCKHQVCNVVPM